MADFNSSADALIKGQSEARQVDGTAHDSPERQLIKRNRWQDAGYAKQIVVQEYDEASKWRKQNHDHRWDQAELLYLAEYPQLTWPGSRMPRSSLGIPITFEQVEAMKPRLTSAMFNDDVWFETIARMGQNPKVVSAAGRIVDDQFAYSNPREVFRRAVGSALMYGNGIMEMFWDRRQNTREQYIPKYISKRRRIVDPITGSFQSVATGEFEMRMVDQKITETINRAAMRYVSLRDFFIDPHAPSVVPGEARYVQKRIMLPLQDLLDLQDVEGFDVPSTPELLHLLNNFRDFEPSDQSRQNANAANRVNLNPNIEYTPDAGIGRVELLIRWSPTQLTWVIGKALTIYNHPNPYGLVPYYNVFYADLVDRFYGLSIADVVEGEQRFQQKLVNARLDELSLSIDPPAVTSSTKLSTFELRYRPGNVAHVDDAAKDVVRQFPQNVTQQVYAEQQQSDIRVQRITGQNESVMQGVPTPQNPVARSAAGANLQASASMSRLQHIVENAENLCFEPMIADAWNLNKLFLDPKEMMDLAKDAQVDPVELFTAKLQPKVRAGSRMMSKQVLAQMFPLVMQSLANGSVLQQLTQEGLTVDWNEMFRILFDATGYARRAELIRPMNEKEAAAFAQQMQQKAAEGQMKMQMQDKRMVALADMQDNKGQMELVKQIVTTVLKNKEAGAPPEQGLGNLLQQFGGQLMGGGGNTGGGGGLAVPSMPGGPGQPGGLPIPGQGEGGM